MAVRTELIFMLFSIGLGACGQLLLKYSVMNMGGVDLGWKNLGPTLWNVFTNGWVVAGILCFVTSMVLWLKVLSTMELSRAYPSVSLSYVLVFVMSVILFKEGVTLEKVGGMLSILLGVFLLHR